MFVPGKPFQPSLMLLSNAEAYQSETSSYTLYLIRIKVFSGALLYGRLLALPKNTRRGWQGLPERKHSSLVQALENYDR